MAKLRLLLNRSGKAFTFVELLIAMVIVAIVSGAVIMLGYTYFRHFEQSTELSMARERGIMVVTYLEKRILNAGLGMPESGSDFTDAFEGLWGADDLKDFTDSRDWDAPVYMPEIEEDDTSSSDELMIAYAVPSGVFTTVSADIGNSDVTVDMSGTLDGTKIENDAAVTKGWVVFPSVLTPFLIIDAPTDKVTIRSARDYHWYLPANDELHHVRILRAFVETERFMAQDMTVSGAQPVIEGVLGCRFSYDDETKVLAVSVLTRGNRSYSRLVSPADMTGWGPVDENWRHYYLSVVNKGWRVRN
jgi:prepilin-type N-terminal cleavage/methylation domain-containing protein